MTNLVTTTDSRRPSVRVKSRRRSGGATAVVALLPFAAFLAIFAVYPLIELLRLSVTETSVQQGLFVSQWTGLGNFQRALTDPEALSSALITLLFVVLAVVSTVLLGLGSALLVDRAVWLLGLARNVLIWPAVVAPVVVSVMWLLLLSPSVGGVNKVLATFGLPAQAWLNSKAGAFVAIVAVDVWHWTPVVFLFLYTALKGIGNEVIEAARIDGVTERQLLRHVILPMLYPAIAVVALLRLVMCVKAFDEMYLLTRGGPDGATNLISLHIRTMFFDRLEFGYAGALSVGIVIVIVLVVGGLAWARNHRWRTS